MFVVWLHRCSLSSSTKRRAGNKKLVKKRLVNGYGLIRTFVHYTEKTSDTALFMLFYQVLLIQYHFFYSGRCPRYFGFFLYTSFSHTLNCQPSCLQLVTFNAAGHLAILLCWEGNEVKLRLFVTHLVLLLCTHFTATNFKEPP